MGSSQGKFEGKFEGRIEGNGNISHETQKDFDISKYLGEWNEVAHLGNLFWQKNCAFSSAKYSWDTSQGYIRPVMKVENYCLDKNRNVLYSRSGEARVENMNDKSKLRIKFNDGLPADPEGSYWVMYSDYNKYSIVTSGANGKYLWILSRTPTIPLKDVPFLMEKVRSFGYDPQKLISNPSLLEK